MPKEPNLGQQSKEKRMANVSELPQDDIMSLIKNLSEQMHVAAEQLQFELAARLRDEIRDLKKELRQISDAQS